MSSPILDLLAKLSIDTVDFDNGLDDAKIKADGFGGIVGKSFGAAAKVGVAAFAAMGTAVVGFGKSSIETGGQFDSAMSQLAATMGKTVNDIQDLSEFAQEMGRTTAFSARESADAMNVLAMAGYTAKEQMETLPAVLNLAAAGGMSIAQAADYATGIIAGFSNETLDAATIAEKLATVASSAKGDVASFGEGLSTVAGMANTTGQSLQDMTVALGILGNNNVSASEAGNALSRVLKNLYQPTDTAATAMREFGLNAYDAEGNARPLQDVLQDLNARISDLSTEGKNEVLSQIFDAATLKTVPALLNNAGAAWDDLNETIENSARAAERMKDVQLDNLEGDITLFKSAVEGAQIAVSGKLMPSMRALVKFGTAGISDMTAAFKDGGIEGLAESFADYVRIGTENIVKAIPGFVNVVGQLTMAIGQGLVAATPTIVESAKTLLQGVYNGFVENIPQMLSAGKEMVGKIAEGFKTAFPEFLANALPLLLSFSGSLRENVGKIVDVGIDLVLSLVDGLIAGLPGLIAYAPQIISNLAGIINDNAPKLIFAGADLIIKLGLGLIQSIPAIIENAGNIVKAIFDVFTAFNWVNLGTQLITALGDGIAAMIAHPIEAASNIINGIKSLFESFTWADLGSWAINGIESGIAAVFDAPVALFRALVASLSTLFTGFHWHGLAEHAMSAIANGISGLVGSVVGAMQGVVSRAANAITSFNWLGIGKAIIDGLVQGITRFGGNVFSSLKNVASNAFNGVKNFLGISSPSKLMREEIGKFIPLGLAEGIEKTAGTVYNAMGDLAKGTEKAYMPDIDYSPAVDMPSVKKQDAKDENLATAIAGLKAAIAGMKIYLYPDQIVGAMAEDIDATLGSRAIFAGRGV